MTKKPTNRRRIRAQPDDFFMGAPQAGQFFALVLTFSPHSLHLINAIFPGHYALTFANVSIDNCQSARIERLLKLVVCPDA